MESLAYLHLAVAHELPDATNPVSLVENHKRWDTLKPDKISRYVQVSLLSLLVASSVLGLAGKALAQQILLRQGFEGPSVSRVQERLRELNYFRGDISGYYGQQTEAAVRSFQGAYGLDVDGVVGDETWSALFDTSVS
ncbi:MAG: peptidoglycan-binding domain-containing protein [Cyanobacteriota bacterium]